MKNLTQKLISFALVITMSMGVATLPAFAADPDTTYFESNSRYYWTGASGTHDLPSGTKLGNLVAKGINFLSLDLASLQSTLSQIGSTLNTTINTNTKPLIDLKSGWGSTLNLYTVPSGYGSSWYAQIVRGLYDIKDLNDSIKSLLYTATGNQTTIINKLNSGINVVLDSTVVGYLQNSSEQLTTLSGIQTNIESNTSIINTNLSNIYSKFGNYLALSPWLSVYVQSQGQGANSVAATSLPVLKYRQFGTEGNYDFRTDTYPYVARDGIMSYLGAMTQNLYVLDTSIKSPAKRYDLNTYRNGVLTNYSGKKSPLSLMDMIQIYSENIVHNLGDLQFVLADEDTISAKQANKQQEQSVLSNFTGSGDASASVSDFVGVKDSVSALKTSLSGGASYTQAFNILGGDSDGWSWFTTEVAESMDSTSNGSTRRGSVPVSTPYLDSYYDSIYSVIGINGGIE